MGSLLLDVRSGDNLSGEVKPFSEVVETLGGESVVVVLPGELGLDVAAGGERLAGLDNVEVLGVDVVVLGKVVVLLCDEDTLSEEVLVDLLAVCLGNKPARLSAYYTANYHDQQFSHLGGCRTLLRESKVVEESSRPQNPIENVVRRLARQAPHCGCGGDLTSGSASALDLDFLTPTTFLSPRKLKAAQLLKRSRKLHISSWLHQQSTSS